MTIFQESLVRARPATEPLGERIRELRGRRTRERFATELGIHKNTLARYEQGERLPDAELLQRLCSLCGVSADWLIHDPDLPVAPPGEGWRLPGTHGAASRDVPLMLRREWLEAQQLRPGDLVAHTMQGDSMVPTLATGELLLVRLLGDEVPADGVHLLELDGATMVKRLHGAGSRNAQLLSDNPAYPPIDLPPGVVGSRCRILGPVLWHLRKLSGPV